MSYFLGNNLNEASFNRPYDESKEQQNAKKTVNIFVKDEVGKQHLKMPTNNTHTAC